MLDLDPRFWFYACLPLFQCPIAAFVGDLESGRFPVMTHFPFCIKSPHHCRSKKSRSIRTGSMQRGSSHGQDFPLRTAVADQHHGHFAGLLIHLRHQPQLIRPARQAFHIKLAKRTVRRRLGRLIIFPALKPSCGIHPRTVIPWVRQRQSHLK